MGLYTRLSIFQEKLHMKNSFTITLEFSYKGENFELAASVDLDEYMQKMKGIPNLHDLIARQNGIDSYSYQYEVLTSEELQFSEVQGFAAEYIAGSEFDAEGFAERWRQERIAVSVAAIAQRVMGISDLAAQPSLKQALLEAYRAGQATSASEE